LARQLIKKILLFIKKKKSFSFSCNNFLIIKTERNNLVQALKENDTIIIMGEMGSGKSTRTYIN